MTPEGAGDACGEDGTSDDGGVCVTGDVVVMGPWTTGGGGAATTAGETCGVVAGGGAKVSGPGSIVSGARSGWRRMSDVWGFSVLPAVSFSAVLFVGFSIKHTLTQKALEKQRAFCEVRLVSDLPNELPNGLPNELPNELIDAEVVTDADPLPPPPPSPPAPNPNRIEAPCGCVREMVKRMAPDFDEETGAARIGPNGFLMKEIEEIQDHHCAEHAGELLRRQLQVQKMLASGVHTEDEMQEVQHALVGASPFPQLGSGE